jgi:penicillin-binding protein 1A
VVSAGAAESRWYDPSAEGAGSCASKAFLAVRGIAVSDALSGEPLGSLRAMAATLLGGDDLAVEAAGELSALSGQDVAVSERVRLAGALAGRYDRRRLAEWLLNVRRYGMRAIGVDDGALTYFGKHAEDLTLAECAALEAIAADPARAQDPDRLAGAREGVLARMLAEGYIGTEEKRTASAAASTLRISAPDTPPFLGPYLERVMARLEEQYPEDELARSGMRVITTLDLGFALQALCGAQNVLARADSADADPVAALDGEPCSLAALLGPGASAESPADFAITAIDPETGELLAEFETARGGGASASRGKTGSALLPLAYLSAFTRGFTPASMLLDIPAPDRIENPDGGYRGPISARAALRERRLAAADGMAAQVGGGNIARTLALLGLPGTDGGEPTLAALMDQNADLPALASGYSVIAGGGMQIAGNRAAEPVVILRVDSRSGATIEEFDQRQTRRIIGADLAYLLQDVLSGETVWAEYGAPALAGSSSTVAAALGDAPQDGGAWAFALTPRFVIGVHATSDSPLGLTPRAPWAVAQAAAGWALRGLPVQSWTPAAGVVRRDVCVPSGLLPGKYCPNVASEIFLAGAEPTQTDAYYQPAAVNRETGRLATLWTPLALVDQKVFFQMTGEARTWAEQSGFPLPPETYDTLPVSFPCSDLLQISQPAALEVLRGTVTVHGTAASAGMQQFIVQAGEGLYPATWYALGKGKGPVRDGNFAVWDTAGSDGIWSLQLIAVLPNGEIESAAIPVTLDNTPPTVRWVEPATARRISLEKGQMLILQVDADDSLALAAVDFRLDGKTKTRMEIGPFSVRWEALPPGDHQVDICARDGAGNENCTSSLDIEIMP